MLAIYKRELKSYFTSMIGPIFIAVAVIFTGIYFMIYNLNVGYQYFSYALGSTLFIYILLVPILTMRSLSEERRSKTDQLLLTSPITVNQMVLGKYLSMVTVFAIACLIFCICPVIVTFGGAGHLASDYASIFVFFVCGCVFIAVGMLVSSLTESPVIAAVGTLGILLLLYFMSSLTGYIPTTAVGSFVGCLILLVLLCLILYYFTKNWLVAGGISAIGMTVCVILYFVKPDVFENLLPSIMEALSFTTNLDTIMFTFVLDFSGLFYYLSVIFVLIFLTVQVVQKRRWS